MSVLVKYLANLSIFITLSFNVNICSYAQNNNPIDAFIIKQHEKNNEYSEKIIQLNIELEKLKIKLISQEKTYKELKKIIINDKLAASKATTSKDEKDKYIVEISNKDYRNARDLVLSEQYNLAIKGLKAYITKYPKAENIADARFWLAGSYMANKNYLEAINGYLLFLAKHKKHYKTPDALYKLAIAQYELGFKKKSEIIFKSIVSRFPNNKVTKLAINSLYELFVRNKIIKTTPSL